MSFEFKLPDIGEGIVEGEVVRVLVKEGDAVKEDTPVLEVMTDKATVELTSPKTGNIAKILCKEGDVIAVGQTMLTIHVAGGAVAATPAAVTAAPSAPSKPSPAPMAEALPTGKPVMASPATRKLARELNVNLDVVNGTGPGGRITDEDVRGFGKSGSTASVKPSPSAPTPTGTGPLEFEGATERIAFRGLRKKIAEKMRESLHHATHFSYVDTVDMTDLVKLRSKWKEDAEKKGVKLNYLPFICKATVEALKKNPRFNAVLDEAAGEIVLKKYYNLGIATATDKGLIVPVVKNVEHKSLLTLAKEIAELSERTRNMKADVGELKGSSFSITSLGALGGLFATPIINYPETAIMGIYQIKPTPVVMDGEIRIRQIMYFSLSLDHRVIDGHEAAGFGNEFKKYLENPSLIFASLS